jgi:hypothetical protein
MAIHLATSLDDFTEAFKSSDEVGLSFKETTFNDDSVRWIDRGGNQFNLDLAGTWLGNIKIFVDWRLLEFLNY